MIRGRGATRDRGAVLVLVAISLVALLGITALAFDVGRMAIAKQRAQEVCDAAALAGAWYLTGEPSSTQVNSGSGQPAGGDGAAARAAKYVALASNDAKTHWKTYTSNGLYEGATVSFPPYPAQSGSVLSDSGTSVPVRLGEAIMVQAVVKVPMTFARILGISQATVAAHATAIIGSSTQTPGPVTVTGDALPWAVADATIWNLGTSPPTVLVQMGTQMTLKVTSPDDPAGFIGAGNFLCVALGGDNGASDYRDRIAGEKPPATFSLDDEIPLYTEPGNMSGPTDQGLQQRLTSDTYPWPSTNSTAWNSWLASYDPATGKRATTLRLGLVPIIRDPGGTLNGRKSLTVVGFAGVFIEGFENIVIGGKTYVRVTGRFTSGIYTATGVIWSDPTVPPPYSSTVSSVRLIN